MPDTQPTKPDFNAAANVETIRSIRKVDVNFRGAQALDAAPVRLGIDSSYVANIKGKFAQIFEAPFSTKDANKSPPTLRQIADYTGKPDNETLNSFRDVQSQAEKIIAQLDGKTLASTDSSPILKHTVAVADDVFVKLYQEIHDKFTALHTSAMDVNGKAIALKNLYKKYANELKKQYAEDKQALAKWINDNYGQLQTIYAEHLKNHSISEADFKKNMEEKLQKQLDDDINYLDRMMQQQLTELCQQVAAKHQIAEANYLASYIENTGAVVELQGNHQFATPVRYDRYGNKFEVEDNKKIICDFRSTGPFGNTLSPEKKADMLFDRALALKQAGNDIINISVSARIIGSSPFAEAQYSNSMPHIKASASMAWRAAVKAGFEIEKINVANYEPDNDDLKFYLKHKSYESYGEFEKANPTLNALLTQNVDKTFKNAKSIKALMDNNKIPILTVEERQKLLEHDWLTSFSRVSDKSNIEQYEDILKAELNEIRPGLGDAIVLDNVNKTSFFSSSDTDKMKVIRGLCADMIKNPLLREFLKEAKTADGQYVIPLLSKQQIMAINNLDFKECNTIDDVVDVFNKNVFSQQNIGSKNNNIHLDLGNLKAGAYFKKTHSSPSSIQKLKDEQKAAQAAVLSNTSTYMLLDTLNDVHKTKINSMLDNSSPNHDELFFHAKNGLAVLNQLHEKLGEQVDLAGNNKGNRFEDRGVAEEFITIAQEYINNELAKAITKLDGGADVKLVEQLKRDKELLEEKIKTLQQKIMDKPTPASPILPAPDSDKNPAKNNITISPHH